MSSEEVKLLVGHVHVRLTTQGLASVRAGYTVELVNVRFTGPIASGETEVVDDDITRLAAELVARIEEHLHVSTGLREQPTAAVTASGGTDWEL